MQGGNTGGPFNASSLKVPKVSTTDCVVQAVPKRVYSNAHAYHINSISVNTDGETFLSSDDLRINIWSLGRNDSTFNVVDIKPENMEELTEVITAAEFHPLHCHQFVYSSSRGSIKLADTRAAALCDSHSKLFEEHDEPSDKSFFAEIVSSISDVKFSHDGRFIVSRDYLTLKVWDINMESRPIKTIQIQDFLRSKLCDLYESDCIFDKFECCFSYDGQNMLTGGYHNVFYVFDRNGKNDVCLEASKNVPNKSKDKSSSSKSTSKSLLAAKPGAKKSLGPDVSPDAVDFEKKVIHLTWHPNQNILAVATLNNLFIYNA